MTSTVTVTYSHAAPYIREQLVMSIVQAANARTIRDRQAFLKQAWAFGRSLEIMAASGDQTPVTGVHLQETYNKGDWSRVLKFLGSADQFEKLLGFAPEGIEPADVI